METNGQISLLSKLLGLPRVPVVVSLRAVLLVFRVLVVERSVKHNIRDVRNKFLPFILVKRHVPDHGQDWVEAGEAVPRGTDGHGGEVQLRDGESLDSGGDWTDGPAGEGL